MIEVLYAQPIYAVMVGEDLYMFSPGTTREQAAAWIEAARLRVVEQEQGN